MLAGGLGDELLEPQPETGQRLGDHERELVAARLRERAERRAQPHAGRLLGARRSSDSAVRGVAHADLPGAAAPASRASHVDADQRGGHDAEGRQRAVAPADVRIAGEHLPEAVLLGELLEARAGVGDRREVGALTDERPEVREQRQRLDRAARLGGDEEQRAVAGRSPARPRGSWPRRSSRARAAPVDRASRPKQRRSTSGASEEPPMPSSTTSRRPSAATAPRTPPARRPRSRIRSAIVSQPRRSAISGVPAGPQSVASSRASLPATSSSAARASLSATAGCSASGM